MIDFRWAAASDPGQIREINQDSAFAGDGVFVVADGMGGHKAGEVASRWAILLLHERLVGEAGGDDQPNPAANAPAAGAAEVIEAANEVIHEQASIDRDLSGMGTTVCALIVHPERTSGTIVNVGDSRAYVFRDGKLEQITEDHSLVETLVREGRLSPADALHHPQRNIVTRALGVEPNVEVDEFPVDLLAGDRYLVCSDGLFGEVADPDMSEVLGRGIEVDETVDILVAKANEAGGHDNVTCVLIDVVDDETDAVAAAPGDTAVEPQFVGAVLDESGAPATMPELPDSEALASARGEPPPTPPTAPDGKVVSAEANDAASGEPTQKMKTVSGEAGAGSGGSAAGVDASDGVTGSGGSKRWMIGLAVIVAGVIALGFGFSMLSGDATYFIGFDGDGPDAKVAIFKDDGGIFPDSAENIRELDRTRSDIELRLPEEVEVIEAERITADTEDAANERLDELEDRIADAVEEVDQGSGGG